MPIVYDTIQNLISDGAIAVLETLLHERDHMGRTPLLMALEVSNIPVASLLAQKGADINAIDNYGYSCLHNICVHGRTPEAKYVIQNYDTFKANLGSTNEQGDTILHSVCKKNNLEIALELLKFGADRNTLNFEGKTPEYYMDENSKNKLLLLFDSNKELTLDTLAANNYELWFWLVQQESEGLQDLIKHYIVKYETLKFAIDTEERSAFDLATNKNKPVLKFNVLWHNMYRVDSPPIHTSTTCSVFCAFDETVLDSTGRPTQVTLKLMTSKSEFIREVRCIDFPKYAFVIFIVG